MTLLFTENAANSSRDPARAIPVWNLPASPEIGQQGRDPVINPA